MAIIVIWFLFFYYKNDEYYSIQLNYENYILMKGCVIKKFLK